MARLDAKLGNFWERGQDWYHFWLDADGAAAAVSSVLATTQTTQSSAATTGQALDSASATQQGAQHTAALAAQSASGAASTEQPAQGVAVAGTQSAAAAGDSEQPRQASSLATTQECYADADTVQAAQTTVVSAGEVQDAASCEIATTQPHQGTQIAARAAAQDIGGGGGFDGYVLPSRNPYLKPKKREKKPEPVTVTCDVATAQAAQGGEVRAVSWQDAGALTAQAAQGTAAAARQANGADAATAQASQGAGASARGQKRERLAQLYELDPEAAIAQAIRWARDAA